MSTDDRMFLHCVDPRGIIQHVNDAWVDFAVENGAESLGSDAVVGTPLFSHLEDATTRHLYELLQRRVLKGEPAITLPYRCDSPAIRRFMTMELRMTGGLIGYHNRIVRQEKRPPVALWESGEERSGEPVRTCGWCKRIPHPDGRWLEVEDAIAELELFHGPALPPLTHGICPMCERLVRSDARDSS